MPDREGAGRSVQRKELPLRLVKLLKSQGLPHLNPENILGGWRTLKDLPQGSLLFSKLLGAFIPYSGTIGAEVRELRPGFAKVAMRDRRRVRNHLSSVHAVALTNLGELATGLAVLTATPKDHRGIVKSLKTDFLKKARGSLTAQAEIAEIPTLETNTPYEVTASLFDAKDIEVARVTATWVIGPSKAKN